MYQLTDAELKENGVKVAMNKLEAQQATRVSSFYGCDTKRAAMDRALDITARAVANRNAGQKYWELQQDFQKSPAVGTAFATGTHWLSTSPSQVRKISAVEKMLTLSRYADTIREAFRISSQILEAHEAGKRRIVLRTLISPPTSPLRVSAGSRRTPMTPQLLADIKDIDAVLRLRSVTETIRRSIEIIHEAIARMERDSTMLVLDDIFTKTGGEPKFDASTLAYSHISVMRADVSLTQTVAAHLRADGYHSLVQKSVAAVAFLARIYKNGTTEIDVFSLLPSR